MTGQEYLSINSCNFKLRKCKLRLVGTRRRFLKRGDLRARSGSPRRMKASLSMRQKYPGPISSWAAKTAPNSHCLLPMGTTCPCGEPRIRYLHNKRGSLLTQRPPQYFRDLPDEDPILRCQIHAVPFMNVVGLKELVKLLQSHVHSQVVERMGIVSSPAHSWSSRRTGRQRRGRTCHSRIRPPFQRVS